MGILGKKQVSASGTMWTRHEAELAIGRTEAAIRAGRAAPEVQRLFEGAFALVNTGAEAGDAWAQCRLGFLYKSFLHDFSEAARWYRKSAEQGNAEAQCKLGYLYRMGKGVPWDNREAATLYRRSAESGYAEGQHNWAVMNSEGCDAVPRDLLAAFRWFSSAAEQGYDESQYNLGIIYFWGNEVIPQDLKKAKHWFTAAANQGHAGALHNLAVADFALGLGAERVVKRIPG